MRKIFTATVVTLSVVCNGLCPAHAGLLGMPLNLRSAIDAKNTDTASVVPAPGCKIYTDDVFAGLIVIGEC